MFQQSLELKREFPDNSRLRMHIDYSEKEQTLVYDYFRDDLLSFVNVNTDISMKAIKQILWEVGLALKEFHEKNWIHIGRIL